MRLLLILGGLMLTLSALTGDSAPAPTEPKMIRAAAAFLATLTPEQAQKAVLPFESAERLNWHYVPKDRAGICYKEMNAAQKAAATALLRAGLSEKGFTKTDTIRRLEDVLREIEQGRGPVRDPDLFYFTFFGAPDAKDAWGWRYEGHHISLHWTALQGKVIASAPQFLGSNPGEVRSGPLKGTRPLKAEEELARSLMTSLNAEQREEAVLSETAPPDIITGAARKAAVLEHRGIPFARLTKEQQGTLLALIREYADAQMPSIAKKRLDALRKAGLDNIKFAWMGGLERGQGHYYRVQGTTFLIEYDNTQNDANHIHTVWRDFKNDFGADLLEMHYQASRHGQNPDH